mmetsp:Transcript_6959/g.22392  ORF Transcript_6959/g.22392 Transcript_6959/m.22392 type:complete len:267 (+) Transcript_6959:637-1437(+)
MALERAVCASRESLRASWFSPLPVWRISSASSMCAEMVLTMSSAEAISPASFCTEALASSSFALSSNILSSLSDLEISVLLSSRSHQFLCLSSSLCSSARWKIIFWIMLFTSSKGPAKCAETSCAKRSRARECARCASVRRSCTARCRGSSLTCRKDTGDGGGTGFVGASVRTPVAFERTLTATFIASISSARVLDLRSHSDFFTMHDCSVPSRVAESACSSSRRVARAPSALMRSSLAFPSSVLLVCFDLVAWSARSLRAAFASS